jgi:excisionase family DNA binding protein
MTAQPTDDRTPRLSIAEAAELLGMSRPCVSMLCDTRKLGAVEMAAGGHRRVHREAAEQYRSQALANGSGTPTVREAGVKARLYEHDDSHYANVVRGSR